MKFTLYHIFAYTYAFQLAKEECKRQAEKVHAKFIKDHIACPTEMARADYIVGTWAKINGE